jgi:cytochrome b pre-mRNA-processing protein 3
VESRVLSWFRRKAEQGRTAKDLYGASVTQARHQAFFAANGVSDTPEGRAGMIMAHLFLLLDRLSRAGAPGERLARALTETFVTDMDDCLREMGVGDLAVPREVKRAAAELRARCLAYRQAMKSDDGALAAELAATLPGLGGEPARASGLARYLRLASAALDALPAADVKAGRLAFPPPDTIAPGPPTEKSQ